jgi:hypothetical protein
MVLVSNSDIIFLRPLERDFLIIINYCYYYLWYWGLNSGPTPQTTPPVLFVMGFFQNRVS